MIKHVKPSKLFAKNIFDNYKIVNILLKRLYNIT